MKSGRKRSDFFCIYGLRLILFANFVGIKNVFNKKVY